MMLGSLQEATELSWICQASRSIGAKPLSGKAEIAFAASRLSRHAFIVSSAVGPSVPPSLGNRHVIFRYFRKSVLKNPTPHGCWSPASNACGCSPSGDHGELG